jgi:hypothetical protein
VIFRMLKYLNENFRFIERTLKGYKETCPRRKLVENVLWEPRRWSRRWGSVSDETATGRCVKWSKTLTEAQKTARVQKFRNLLAWHAGDGIIFSDEKLFLLQETHNQQNDLVYSVFLRDVPQEKLDVKRFSYTEKKVN